MALEFDITRAPPALEEITREREQAERELTVMRKKNIRFLVIAATALIMLLCFQLLVAVPAVRDPGSSPDFVSILALYTPYLIGTFFFTALTLYNKYIEKPRKLVDATLAALKEVTPDDPPDLAGAERHDEIAAYREKVVAQGRAPVRAEVEAMQRWLEARKPEEDT